MASEPNDTPARPTSTAAFRAYLSTVDGLVERRGLGATSDEDVWAAWEVVKNVLVSHLADAVHVRLLYLAEAAADRPPIAGPHSYVHRAHSPSAGQEPGSSSSDASPALPGGSPGGAGGE